MKVHRYQIKIEPNNKRVLFKPFIIFSEERKYKIIKRILNLTETEVNRELSMVIAEFEKRHHRGYLFFLNRFEQMKKYVSTDEPLSEERKVLIGAYFTQEFSLESTAIFNPSMIWHPNQSNLPAGKKRFIISLRATGEGHVSSIVFRSGIIDEQSNIKMDEPSQFVEMPEIKMLNDNFYEAHFNPEDDISERAIFPQMPSESNGIEDARFVEFKNDDGESTYFATYCAYDGHNISTQLLQTKDFLNFKIGKMMGREIQNKGMALFPHKIDGKYVMLSRQDNENIFIMFSDDVYKWESKQLLMEPEYPWEFFQIGNCGSPVETEKGWLCLSHGVGAARKYVIGAFLLDKDDPTKLIGRLKKPLLEANELEREGYVPHVVYSCGGVINGRDFVFPYAMSDYASSFASVDLNELLDELTKR